MSIFLEFMNEFRKNISLSGIAQIPASKSILNRVLIISTFLDSTLEIRNISDCNDIKNLVENLRILGWKIEIKDNSFLVFPKRKKYEKVTLETGNSATGFRFILARVASLENVETKFVLSSQLQKRPHQQLFSLLKKTGAEISENDSSITVKGTKLNGGGFNISADISSQFASALLLIAPVYKKDLILVLDKSIVSENYIKLTLKIMKDFGIDSEFKNGKIKISAGQKYQNPHIYKVEPDFSSAAYFWALGALSDDFICTEGIYRNTFQSDYNFLKILQEAGAKISIDNDKICVKTGRLKGIEIEMKNMPDQVPTLAVLALLAESETLITNISHLRYKESDRIKSLLTEIHKIGGKIEYENGNLKIFPLAKPPHKIQINSHDDHRIAMAFQILKEIFPYLKINRSEVVAKSFPRFFSELEKLRK